MEPKSKQPTQEEVLKAIENSGYPFELTVAKQFLDFGFEIQPGSRFFDRNRQKDVEIDLRAMLKRSYQTTKGNTVTVVLQLMVECKDNSLPFVFFGLDYAPEKEEGMMDPDWPFVHVNTTRDKRQPNRHGMVCFLNDKKNNSFKKDHHHFASGPRFFRAATMEWKDKTIKLSETSNLQDALRKLASFIDHFHATWISLAAERDIEEMTEGVPYIYVPFLLIVHSGQQFRYSLSDRAITQSTHTPVFQSYHVAGNATNIVVDFVAFDKLQAAVETIDKSLQAMARIMVPSVLAETKGGIYSRSRN